jgi:hypothetical protein
MSESGNEAKQKHEALMDHARPCFALVILGHTHRHGLSQVLAGHRDFHMLLVCWGLGDEFATPKGRILN